MARPTRAKASVTPAERLTAVEAGKLLGIDDGRVRAAIDRGELPGLRVGREYVIYRAAIEAVVAGSWSPRLEDKTAQAIAERLAGELPVSPFLRRVERLRKVG